MRYGPGIYRLDNFIGQLWPSITDILESVNMLFDMCRYQIFFTDHNAKNNAWVNCEGFCHLVSPSEFSTTVRIKTFPPLFNTGTRNPKNTFAKYSCSLNSKLAQTVITGNIFSF